MAALLSFLNETERADPDVSSQNRPPSPLGFEFVNVYNGRPGRFFETERTKGGCMSVTGVPAFSIHISGAELSLAYGPTTIVSACTSALRCSPHTVLRGGALASVTLLHVETM